jgi:hypothetical protein
LNIWIGIWLHSFNKHVLGTGSALALAGSGDTKADTGWLLTSMLRCDGQETQRQPLRVRGSLGVSVGRTAGGRGQAEPLTGSFGGWTGPITHRPGHISYRPPRLETHDPSIMSSQDPSGILPRGDVKCCALLSALCLCLSQMPPAPPQLSITWVTPTQLTPSSPCSIAILPTTQPEPQEDLHPAAGLAISLVISLHLDTSSDGGLMSRKFFLLASGLCTYCSCWLEYWPHFSPDSSDSCL